jgi:hypothetical protein
VDKGGADVYDAAVGQRGGANGGSLQGAGLLVDEGSGDDTFTARLAVGGGNGGAVGGAAILVDDGGFNAFSAPAAPSPLRASHGAGIGLGPVPGNPLPATGGLGMLLAGPGPDTFTSDGVTQGAGDRQGVGVLVDLGGANQFLADGPGLAQGAGAGGGLGLLLDGGSGSLLQLTNGPVGQGAGLAGVGLVLRTARGEGATYLVDEASEGLAARDGGVGMRLERSRPVSPTPTLACQGEEVASIDQELVQGAVVALRVCHPGTEACLPEPLDGRCAPAAGPGGGLVLLEMPSLADPAGAQAEEVRARLELGPCSLAGGGCPG